MQRPCSRLRLISSSFVAACLALATVRVKAFVPCGVPPVDTTDATVRIRRPSGLGASRGSTASSVDDCSSSSSDAVFDDTDDQSYSYSYPKYRIDFTTLKSVKATFLWPWQRMQAQRQLQEHCKANRIGRFLWIDSQSEYYNSLCSNSFAGTTSSSSSSSSNTNVAILSFLWRLAANTTDTASVVSGRASSSVTVAFPENTGSERVIRCWVEMMQWLVSYAATVDNSRDGASISFASTKGIPTVTISGYSHRPLNSTVPLSSHVVNDNVDHQHETIAARTKSWVQRVLVNLGICPFTKSVKLSGQGLAEAGIPVGRIAYHSSFASPTSRRTSNERRNQTAYDVERLFAGMCQLHADAWEAIRAMLDAGPDVKTGGVSSILLAAPAWDAHFAVWSGPVFALLNAGVVAAAATESIGVVCFHPYYQTPDGTSFPGFGQMHSVPRLQQWLIQHFSLQSPEAPPPPSLPLLATMAAAGGAWQRRTPHATINVLRADQLKAAENYRSSPKLYVRNVLQLQTIGWDKLQEQLKQERHIGG